jgi:hypothetical protein
MRSGAARERADAGRLRPTQSGDGPGGRQVAPCGRLAAPGSGVRESQRRKRLQARAGAGRWSEQQERAAAARRCLDRFGGAADGGSWRQALVRDAW